MIWYCWVPTERVHAVRGPLLNFHLPIKLQSAGTSFLKIDIQINLPLDIPFKKIDKKIVNILFYGSNNVFIEELQFKRFYKKKLVPFNGLLYLLQRQYNFIS